jgi:hypothetical protein
MVGNVGIGTTAPSATLHVAGDFKVQTMPDIAGTAVVWDSTTYQLGIDIAEFFPAKGYLGDGLLAALSPDGTAKVAEENALVLGPTAIAPAMLIEGSWHKIGPKREDLFQPDKSPVALLGRVPVWVEGEVQVGDVLVAAQDGKAKRWEPGMSALGYVGLCLDVASAGGRAMVLTGHHGLPVIIAHLQEEITRLKGRVKELCDRLS